MYKKMQKHNNESKCFVKAVIIFMTYGVRAESLLHHNKTINGITLLLG